MIIIGYRNLFDFQRSFWFHFIFENIILWCTYTITYLIKSLTQIKNYTKQYGWMHIRWPINAGNGYNDKNKLCSISDINTKIWIYQFRPPEKWRSSPKKSRTWIRIVSPSFVRQAIFLFYFVKCDNTSY